MYLLYWFSGVCHPTCMPNVYIGHLVITLFTGLSSQFSAVCHLTCMPNVYLGHLLPYLLVFWFVIAVQCFVVSPWGCPVLDSLVEHLTIMTGLLRGFNVISPRHLSLVCLLGLSSSAPDVWLVCHLGSTSSAQDTCNWLVTWVQRHLLKTLMTGLSRGFNVIYPRHLWLACHVGSTSFAPDTCDWLVTWVQRHLWPFGFVGFSPFYCVCCFIFRAHCRQVFAVSPSRLTVVGVCYFIFQAHCRKVFAVSSSGLTVVRFLLLHLPGSLSSGVCYFIFRDHYRQVFAVPSSGLTVVRCLPIDLLGSLSSGVCWLIFWAHCRQVFAVSSSGLTVVRALIPLIQYINQGFAGDVIYFPCICVVSALHACVCVWLTWCCVCVTDLCTRISPEKRPVLRGILTSKVTKANSVYRQQLGMPPRKAGRPMREDYPCL